MTTEEIKPVVEFVKFCLRQLCPDAEDIVVEGVIDDRGGLVTASVPKAHMARVIGRNGQTARSLRTLVRSMGSSLDIRCALRIVEIDEAV